MIRNPEHKTKVIKELAKTYCTVDKEEIADMSAEESRNSIDLTASLLMKKFDHEKYSLLYQERCLMEALRIDPPIPFSTMHVTTGECKLANGELLPKGTRFSFNFFAIHHDVTQYHHPEKFLPERYSKRSEFYLTPGME